MVIYEYSVTNLRFHSVTRTILFLCVYVDCMIIHLIRSETYPLYSGQYSA